MSLTNNIIRGTARALFCACTVLLAPTAFAADIQVVPSSGDLVLNCPGEFSLRFSKAKGGGITEYYDLKQDPSKGSNLAALGGSLYDGLFFVMFKQADPEAWTASFRSGASVLEVLDATPGQVKIHAAGDFPSGGFGLPASYDFTYIVTSSAKIFIRTRITFKQAYVNDMQIRLALGLSAAHATPTGWTEFSQDTDLTPWYYNGGGDDDYLGARIETSTVRVDPVLITYQDWGICDYILTIAPPKADECLIAWVSSRAHSFSAGQVIERKFQLLMNQRDVTSHADPSGLAASYRAGNGGDFDGNMGSPQAVIQASPTSGMAPLAVVFDGAGSSDPGGAINAYEWNFGDGTSATGISTTHTYSAAGVYTATLTVRDNELNEATASKKITVADSHTVIIDNTDPAPRFTTQGSWLTNNINPGFYGTNYALNGVGAGAEWARWRPELSLAGPYRVYASWTTDTDRPTGAPFTVNHGGGAETILVNMRNTDSSGWNLLGEFEFAAGTAGTVELTDGAASGAEVVADAVKFEFAGQITLVDAPIVDGGEIPPDGGSPAADRSLRDDVAVLPVADRGGQGRVAEASGCDCKVNRGAATEAGLWWIMILLLLGARGVRHRSG